MRRWLTTIVAALAIALAAQSPASAQGDRELGLAVGVTAPDIAGHTQAGDAASFETLRGDKGLVLVFVRSADWCPFCKKQLADLNAISGELEARGFKLVALSYDSVETLARFSKSSKITYALVSDPWSAVIDAFGVRNLDVAGNRRMNGIPHPAIFVIGADRTILDKLYEDNYRDRPPAELILKAVATHAVGPGGAS